MNKEKLSRFQAQLKAMFPGTDIIFKCPLCYREFKTVKEDDNQISDAHIIPQALGGRNKTLVCKRCDETIGGHLEGKIINFINETKVISAKKTGRIRSRSHLSIAGKDIVVQPNFTEDEDYKFRIPKPSDAQFFMETVEQSRGSLKFDLKISRKAIHQDEIERFYLKSAYLAAFDEWGYEYVLKTEVNEIREFLIGLVQEKPYSFGKILFKSLANKDFQFPEYIITVLETGDFKHPFFLCEPCVIFLPPLEYKSIMPFSGYGLDTAKELQIKFSNFDGVKANIEVTIR